MHQEDRIAFSETLRAPLHPLHRVRFVRFGSWVFPQTFSTQHALLLGRSGPGCRQMEIGTIYEHAHDEHAQDRVARDQYIARQARPSSRMLVTKLIHKFHRDWCAVLHHEDGKAILINHVLAGPSSESAWRASSSQHFAYALLLFGCQGFDCGQHIIVNCDCQSAYRPPRFIIYPPGLASRHSSTSFRTRLQIIRKPLPPPLLKSPLQHATLRHAVHTKTPKIFPQLAPRDQCPRAAPEVQRQRPHRAHFRLLRRIRKPRVRKLHRMTTQTSRMQLIQQLAAAPAAF